MEGSTDLQQVLDPLPAWMRRHRLVNLLLRLFPRAHNQWITFNGNATAYVDLHDPEMRNVFLKKSFEPDYFELAQTVLAEGGVYFDCGANFGLCTFGLLPLIDQARVSCHLFEANSNLINYIRKSSSIIPSTQFEIIQGCISDHPGSSRFAIDPKFTGRSRVSSAGEEIVQNVVLDDYIEERAIDTITLLKIDIEGQELNAFRGLTRSFARGAVKMIFFELANDVLAPYGLKPDTVTTFLEESGFSLFGCRYAATHDAEPCSVRFLIPGLNSLKITKYSPGTDPIRTDLLGVHRSLLADR